MTARTPPNASSKINNPYTTFFMKTQVYHTLKVLCLIMTILAGCNDSTPEPTKEEKYHTRLDGTWKITDARVDDLPVTSAFSNLTLALDGDIYEITNAVPPIWPNGGTISLEETQGAQPFALKRSDDVVMTVTELTATTLALKFQYTAANNNGRLSALSGNYEFRFTK
jgi:hypothetical protein